MRQPESMCVFDKLSSVTTAAPVSFAKTEAAVGAGLKHIIDVLGSDRIMFETDFPHPTCLYPDPIEFMKKSIAPLDVETRRKLVQDNAAKLYKVNLAET